MTYQFLTKLRSIDIFKRCAKISTHHVRVIKGLYANEEQPEVILENTTDNVMNKLERSKLPQRFDKAVFKRLKIYLRRMQRSKSNYAFIGDIDVAEKIASHLNNKAEVVEFNPGLGLLTHFLLKQNVKKIVVFEGKEKNPLNDFEDVLKTRNTLEIRHENLCIATRRAKDTIKDLILATKKTDITIFGVLATNSFVTNIVNSIFHNVLWTEIHNLELYLLVPANIYNNISNFPKSQRKFYFYSVFQFFFSITLLDEFPDSTILPLEKNNSRLSTDKACFIRARSRKDCWNVISRDNYLCYVNFLKILDRKRYDSIIFLLEKWIPDCGPHLIAKGITCFTQLRDLTAEDSVFLFDICLKCEGFNNFIAMQDTFDISRTTAKRKFEMSVLG